VIEIGRDRALLLVSQARTIGTYAKSEAEAYADGVTGYLGGGADIVVAKLAERSSSIAHQIDLWRAGQGATFKIISGDFRSGRALIVMDGLQLRNRGNAVEIVPFGEIKTVQQLHTEKRVSTVERAKSVTLGSVIGGGIGKASSLFSMIPGGGIGAAVGGTLGALLAVSHKYQTCRITLYDDRKVIAVAASTNWLALLASIPEKKSRVGGWMKRLRK
jgi:hypothetical protein